MLRNIFFHKNMVRENSPPSRYLKEKRWPEKSEISKVLFPDIGKITNHNVFLNQLCLAYPDFYGI